MKTNPVIVLLIMVCVFFAFPVQAKSSHSPLEQAVLQTVAAAQAAKYYVPLIQLNEEVAPDADGPSAGIFWVEIGSTSTADGYEPEFFYLLSDKCDTEGKDGPSGPYYEEIIPAVFNEAYRRFASNPASAKADINQTRKLLTAYYRQVQTEKK